MEKEYVKVIVAVDAVIEKDQRYLLVQEKGEPSRGLWGFPAGRVEVGEKIEEAVVREVKEETGYSVKLIGKITVIHESLEKYVKHIFAAKITGGDLKFPEDEIMDVQWFSFQEIKAMKNILRFDWIPEVIMRYEKNF